MKLNMIYKKMDLKLSLIGLFLVVTILAPVAGNAQPGGPGGGGNPEGVPFDDDMNIAFLIAGVLFAAFVVYKQLRKKIVAQ